MSTWCSAWPRSLREQPRPETGCMEPSLLAQSHFFDFSRHRKASKRLRELPECMSRFHPAAITETTRIEGSKKRETREKCRGQRGPSVSFQSKAFSNLKRYAAANKVNICAQLSRRSSEKARELGTSTNRKDNGNTFPALLSPSFPCVMPVFSVG
jgi:hypothetical protein